MDLNSVNNLLRGPPKEHSCQVWSKLAQRFGRRCLKKLLTTQDRHLTTLKTPLQYVVLRWAKNEKEEASTKPSTSGLNQSRAKKASGIPVGSETDSSFSCGDTDSYCCVCERFAPPRLID